MASSPFLCMGSASYRLNLKTTRSKQRLCADHDAVGISVQPVAGTHPNALDAHCHVALALVALFGRQWHQRQRANADGRGIQLGHIAHTTVNQ